MNHNSSRTNIQLSLIHTFRGLWSNHVLWSRSYIINTLLESRNESFVTERIKQNNQDFADAFWKFYGYENSKKCESLLDSHFYISEKLLNSVQSGDMDGVYVNKSEWYKSADEFVEFLISINKHWHKEIWDKMMDDHYKVTEYEVIYRFTNHFAAENSGLFNAESQALEMADYMAEGIIQQFHI